MMHLTNSTGQMVSLLNDGGAAAASLRRHAHAKSLSLDTRQTLPSLATLSVGVSDDSPARSSGHHHHHHHPPHPHQEARRSTLGDLHHQQHQQQQQQQQRGTSVRYYSYGGESSSQRETSSANSYPPPSASSPTSPPISPATTIRPSPSVTTPAAPAHAHSPSHTAAAAAGGPPTKQSTRHHYSEASTASTSSPSSSSSSSYSRNTHHTRPTYPSFPSSSSLSSNSSTHSSSSDSEGRRLSSTTASSSSDSSLHRRTSSHVAAVEPPVDLTASTPFLQHAAANTAAPPPIASPAATASSRTFLPSPISSSHRSNITFPIITAGGHRRHTSKSHPPRPQLFHRRAYSPATDSRKNNHSSPSAASPRASPGLSPTDLADSPVFSPGAQQTPLLLRHHSGASSAYSLSTPSPMTPTYGFDPLDQSKQAAAMSGLVDPYHAYPRHPAAAPYFPGPPPAAAPAGHPMAGAPPPSFYPLSGQPPPPLGGPEDAFAMPPGPAPPAHMGVVPYPTDLIEPSPQFAPPPPATGGASVSPPNQHASPANASQGTAQQKARKKYPCPHANRYGCTDTFTTSGHAARHGKKHTGEKNILCPTCHKAFTRKDNMKQHERTHRNNRDSVNSAGSGHTDGTSNKRGKPNHASTSSIGHRSDAASTGSVPPQDMELDPALNFDPQLRGTQPHGTMLPPAMDFNNLSTGNVFLDADLEAGGPSPAADETTFGHAKRPAGVERQVSHGSQDGEGESPGLDALAMAASGFS